MREPYLSGQVITPRHPRKLAVRAFLLATVPAGLLLGAFALGTRFPAQARAAVPSTDSNWIVDVTWEPVRPGRFLGVEKVADADVCRLHVAAEAKHDEQLRAIQAGTAQCFETAFTREREDEE